MVPSLKGRFWIEKKCGITFSFFIHQNYYITSYFQILPYMALQEEGPCSEFLKAQLDSASPKTWVHFFLNWIYLVLYGIPTSAIRPIQFNSFCKVFSASIQLSIRFRPCVSWGVRMQKNPDSVNESPTIKENDKPSSEGIGMDSNKPQETKLV